MAAVWCRDGCCREEAPELDSGGSRRRPSSWPVAADSCAVTAACNNLAAHQQPSMQQAQQSARCALDSDTHAQLQRQPMAAATAAAAAAVPVPQQGSDKPLRRQGPRRRPDAQQKAEAPHHAQPLPPLVQAAAAAAAPSHAEAAGAVVLPGLTAPAVEAVQWLDTTSHSGTETVPSIKPCAHYRHAGR